MIREIYIINIKTVQDFEKEIGFAIDSDYTIVLYDKKDGVIMGVLYNKFEGWLEIDINPVYKIQLSQVEIHLLHFLDSENDPVWNPCKKYLFDIHIIDKALSKWKDRVGYIYWN
ncbi:hypothetical protein SAMN05880574_1128 [Chryseobacterium sp. RU37D]|uniref:hypothetical protein n=1 Tax=Chryseobacterium sp. RU37D TaxID=1907397 RepID=UPI000953B1D2|nr:hypothetical protein [Chryseobacterium sp. RU37D]SIQ39778.1 hypothetical protein SAMN05880574_1128 [Chryseobacterium sp. RU37D]